MPAEPRSAIAAFARRAALGAFVAAALRTLLLVAAVAALVLLALRLWGHHARPQPLWALALLPVLGAGLLAARRERPTAATAAAHLDRRLGLDGLLLCAHAGLGLDDAQRARLSAGLAGLPAALPRLRWRALLPWPALAVLVATVVALLPPPPAPSLPRSLAAAQQEVARLDERLRELLARGELPEEAQRELAQKVAELQQRLQQDDVPEWREFDELDRRLDREQLLQAAAAETPTDAGAANEAEGGAATTPSPTDVAAAADALAQAGQLDALPEAVRAQLAAAQRADGSFAADRLPLDPAALQQLAQALAELAQQPGVLQQLQHLDGGQLADLRAVLDAFAGGAAGQGEDGRDGEGAGRGGVDRGPGHAALQLTEAAVGEASGALPLPPGQPLPGEWVPVGDRRAAPVTAPETNRSAGGQGAAGSGGASWQLDLRPGHRAVVQRYFDAGARPADAEGPKEKR
ncbi:MAG: hypothetical protein JNL08_09545 [Planctomycetes bacterium]|nr:hypothetical protein [Planctomycetota bacterium]